MCYDFEDVVLIFVCCVGESSWDLEFEWGLVEVVFYLVFLWGIVVMMVWDIGLGIVCVGIGVNLFVLGEDKEIVGVVVVVVCVFFWGEG